MESVIEGKKQVILQLIVLLRPLSYIQIEGIEMDWEEPTGEFGMRFEIR